MAGGMDGDLNEGGRDGGERMWVQGGKEKWRMWLDV